MTAPTEEFVEITNRSQDAIKTAVRAWADTVQSFASNLTSGQAQPDLLGVVDQYFDFAEKVLANQREFVHQWASATMKVTEAMTEQAQRATRSVTEHTANGAEAVADSAAATARVAGERTAATARGARINGRNN